MFLQRLGFTCCVHDTSLFTRYSAHGTVIPLAYVDDIIITGSTAALIQDVTRAMYTTFKIKDLGPLLYFLGMEVSWTGSGLLLHQSKYAQDLLQKDGLEKRTRQPTPMAISSSTNGADTPFADITHFRSLIEALQYLAITRLDIQVSVNRDAQRKHIPIYHKKIHAFHTLNKSLEIHLPQIVEQ